MSPQTQNLGEQIRIYVKNSIRKICYSFSLKNLKLLFYYYNSYFNISLMRNILQLKTPLRLASDSTILCWKSIATYASLNTQALGNHVRCDLDLWNLLVGESQSLLESLSVLLPLFCMLLSFLQLDLEQRCGGP